MMDIPVLYEDAYCFVVNKPACITVHPAGSARFERTLVEIVSAKRNTQVFLVHRLDRDTTGCLLLAKSRDACDRLQSQFRTHNVKKRYLAICFGVPGVPEAVIRAPVGRSLVNRTKMSLFRTGNSREAVTAYKVLSHSGGASLVECNIMTGRTHQIRVHLSAIGHPILGDKKYATALSEELSVQVGAEGMCLHAWQLGFHGIAGVGSVNVRAELPQSFQIVAGNCGLQTQR